MEESIRVRIGNWEGDADTNTSNWIEFEYIVDGLERKGQEENLTGVTLFLYIGNSTVDFFCIRGALYLNWWPGWRG